MDIVQMAEALDDAAAVEIRLEMGQPGVQVPARLYTGVNPERHLGYAAQWFGLAIVLAVGYVFVGLKRNG